MKSRNIQKMNLFELADENCKFLIKQCQSIKTNLNGDLKFKIYLDFINNIKNNWTISINMKLRNFNLFLISGNYKNIHKIKAEEKKILEEHFKSKISIEIALKTHLKKYFNLRILFDNLFEDGKLFKYGALNIGALGINYYGKFCIILDRSKLNNYSSLAFLKEDSLNYIEGKHLNIKKLRKEIANKKCVYNLTIIKYLNDIFKNPPENWNYIICNDYNYIEAIIKDEILITHIKCVRIKKDDYDSYFELLYENNISRLSEFDKYQLDFFKGILELMERYHIKWELF